MLEISQGDIERAKKKSWNFEKARNYSYSGNCSGEVRKDVELGKKMWN